MHDVTLTVIDPHYRGRILAVHGDLSKGDNADLAAVYSALGSPVSSIGVAPKTEQSTSRYR